MSAHLLHIHIDGDFGNVWFTVTCDHPKGAPWVTVNEAGAWQSDDCWVPDWTEELTVDEYLVGEWPEYITFPCPVECSFTNDSVAVTYGAPMPEVQP